MTSIIKTRRIPLQTVLKHMRLAYAYDDHSPELDEVLAKLKELYVFTHSARDLAAITPRAADMLRRWFRD